MDLAGIFILIIGTTLLSGVVAYTFYSVYRKFLIFFASEISSNLQGLQALPRPPLRDLVKLVEFLVLKKDKIEKDIEEQLADDKYHNPYQ